MLVGAGGGGGAGLHQKSTTEGHRNPYPVRDTLPLDRDTLQPETPWTAGHRTPRTETPLEGTWD